jgi:RsbT co-antagonist protein rsbRD N-terminal domain
VLGVSPQAQQAVARQWLSATIQAYPSATAQFLRQEKDIFRNPIGAALNEGMPLLVEELFGGMEPGKIAEALGGIVRIRAVQDFSPREAVGFIFMLKKILRDKLPACPEVIGELDSRVDDMALVAFDLFMRCREEVYELRLSETRRREGVSEKMLARNEGG